MDPVTTAAVTWVARRLAEKAVGSVTARLRRGQDAPEVRKALTTAVKAAVAAAVVDAYPEDPTRQQQVTAALLEREDAALPLVDGTGLPHLVDAVRVWIAEIESPIGEHGFPERVDRSHPLAAVLCAAILDKVHWEATRGDRALHPLWVDFKLTCLEPLGRQRQDRLRDYWHPDTAGTGFVGRSAELAALDAALGTGGTGRTQVVSGFGGIGKTALAVAYAKAHAGRYRDGRIFYDLQSYAVGRAPESADQALVKILPTIRDDLSSAGVEQMTALGRLSAWQESTADRELLMVWDNVKSAEQIRPLLLRQDGCTTIVTTRDHIDLDGDTDPLWLDALDSVAARDLFIGIAGEGQDDALVRRLLTADLYVPILIKAHAQQVRVRRRSLAEITAELERASQRRTQQALFDRLDGSYRYLGPDQRYAFRFLGAHLGRFATVDATAVVLGCEPAEAIGLMEDLVDVGLAQRHHHERPEHFVEELTAYTAHDILRAYAAHQARLEHELDPLRAELLSHYRRRLDAYGQKDLAWLEIELDNIAATARAGSTTVHAELAMEAGGHLFGFGRFTDAASMYAHASRVYQGSGDRDRRGHALVGLGDVARLQGEWDRSFAHCREAVDIFEVSGDRAGLIKASVGLGHVARLKGEHDAAAQYFTKAAEEAAAVGDRPVQARALVGLGHVLRLQRRYPEATRRFDEAAALDDRLQRANALRGLGDVLRAQDEPAAADTHYRQAAKTYADLGDRNGQANAYLGRGAVALIEGDWDEATRRYRTAADIFTELGNRFGLATALRGMGTAAEPADPDRARQLLHEALAIYASLKSPAARGLRNQLGELEHRYPT